MKLHGSKETSTLRYHSQCSSSTPIIQLSDVVCVCVRVCVTDPGGTLPAAGPGSKLPEEFATADTRLYRLFLRWCDSVQEVSGKVARGQWPSAEKRCCFSWTQPEAHDLSNGSRKG